MSWYTLVNHYRMTRSNFKGLLKRFFNIMIPLNFANTKYRTRANKGRGFYSNIIFEPMYYDAFYPTSITCL